jgi:hypothetical protein
MLAFIRDVFTLLFFLAVFGGLMYHTIVTEFGWMFEKSAKASKPVKKFQGSASTWVK